MKGISTLIKLQKSQLDALRAQITKLEEQKQLQTDLIMYLGKQLEEEEKQATQQAHLSQFFGDFSKRIKSQQEAAREIIRKLDKQIGTLQDQMRLAFGELKKLEITEANHIAREKAERERLDQDRLDEVALQQFGRKESRDG